jgi:hypothetical protein
VLSGSIIKFNKIPEKVRNKLGGFLCTGKSIKFNMVRQKVLRKEEKIIFGGIENNRNLFFFMKCAAKPTAAKTSVRSLSVS